MPARVAARPTLGDAAFRSGESPRGLAPTSPRDEPPRDERAPTGGGPRQRRRRQSSVDSLLRSQHPFDHPHAGVAASVEINQWFRPD